MKKMLVTINRMLARRKMMQMMQMLMIIKVRIKMYRLVDCDRWAKDVCFEVRGNKPADKIFRIFVEVRRGVLYGLLSPKHIICSDPRWVGPQQTTTKKLNETHRIGN